MRWPDWRSPRLWLLAASLMTRGAGFFTSFALSRLAGVEALGAYSTVVNTASAVVAPVAGVMGNNATLQVAESQGQPRSAAAAASAQLLIAAGLTLLCWLLFQGVGASTVASVAQPGLHGWMSAAAASVIVGQLMLAVVQACYTGQGRFGAAAAVSGAVSLAVVLCIAPALHWWGEAGAYALLLVSSWAPVLVLVPALVRQAEGRRAALRPALRLLLAGLPAIGATAVNSLAGWYCSIYLVQQVHGVAGVGVVAIAAQWLTLMLIPATSWGGLTLKSLKDAMDDPVALRAATFSLARKNLAVTAALAAAIAAAGWLIAAAYGLAGTPLALLILVNALVAVISSVKNVLERLFLCLGHQRPWLWISALCFGLQAIAATWWISHGLVAVVLSVVLSHLCLVLMAGWLVRSVLWGPKEGAPR